MAGDKKTRAAEAGLNSRTIFGARLVCFLLFVSAAVTAGVAAYLSPGTRWVVAILAFVSAGFLNALAAFVVIWLRIDRLQAELKNHEKKQEMRGQLGSALAFWDRKAFASNTVIIVYGGGLSSMRGSRSEAPGAATAKSVEEVERVLKLVHRDVKIVRCGVADLTLAKVETPSIQLIILGGYLTVKPLEQLRLEANLPYWQELTKPEDRKVICNHITRSSELQDDRVVKDLALVTIIVEATGRHVLWISGNYGLGTFGAVLALTRPGAAEGLSYPDPGFYRQVVVEIGSIENEWIEFDHAQLMCGDPITGALPPNFSISTLWRPQAAGG
jgi:hypothetical protein